MRSDEHTKICSAVRADGKACTAYSLRAKNVCFRHDPDSREKGIEASALGGSSNLVELVRPLQHIPLENPKDVVKVLAQTVTEIRSGALDPRVGTTIAYVSRQLLTAMEAAYNYSKTENSGEIVEEMTDDDLKSVKDNIRALCKHGVIDTEAFEDEDQSVRGVCREGQQIEPDDAISDTSGNSGTY